MGNSRFHRHVYELLRERRGAVLMHDVQLTGFYGYYAGVERPQDPLGALVERVRRQYGARIPPDELGTAPLDAERRVALGIYLTEEVQRHAEQLLVHSRDARALLQADGRGLQTRVPISIVPHALPAAQEGAQRSGAASSPVVVHLGALSDEKSLAVLIRAFARFAAGQPAARLVIAGPADSSERARWQQFAGEQAPGASVEIPGRVDECRYRALLARADLAVQLRSVSNGEASGATADCLAAGVPTIVTDLGWSGELPADTVALTPAGVSPEALSELMTALTLDTPRRTALSERALALGGRWSFEHVASEVIGALAL
jgi:glycosyltransferase involved in cell wall biosynthesis